MNKSKLHCLPGVSLASLGVVKTIRGYLRARIKFQSTEFPTTRTVKRNPKEAVNPFCYVLSKDDSDGQPNDSHNF